MVPDIQQPETRHGHPGAGDELSAAVDGLGAADSAEHLPRGFLSRAWLRAPQGDHDGGDSNSRRVFPGYGRSPSPFRASEANVSAPRRSLELIVALLSLADMMRTGSPATRGIMKSSSRRRYREAETFVQELLGGAPGHEMACEADEASRAQELREQADLFLEELTGIGRRGPAGGESSDSESGGRQNQGLLQQQF